MFEGRNTLRDAEVKNVEPHTRILGKQSKGMLPAKSGPVRHLTKSERKLREQEGSGGEDEAQDEDSVCLRMRNTL